MEARLTHGYLDNLKPEPERYSVRDTEARGLRVMVTPTGHKSFSWVGRSLGRVVRVTIGTYPGIPLEEARTKAKRLVADAAEGIQIRKRNPAKATGLTFGEAFDFWYANHVTKHRADPKMLADRFERWFSDWRDRVIADISTADIEERHTSIGVARGPVSANMAVKFFSQIVRYVSARKAWVGDNPAAGLKMFDEQSRERFLQADELPKFFEAVKALETSDANDFFLMCLWTGARKGNVATMELNEIHGDVWIIPKEKAKKKKPIYVPLVAQALEIIDRRKKKTKRYIFPSVKSNTGHYMGGQTAWRKIKRVSGLEDLRIHDLRRTLASWQAAGGTSELIIGRTLGHTSSESTRIYARLNLDPVRAAIKAATTAIESASKNKSKKRPK